MEFQRKPVWLKTKPTNEGEFPALKHLLRDQGLNTICSSGRCPNRNECWSLGTASFMILGEICTRSCRFCNVTHGRPLPPDSGEPVRLAETIRELGLKHAVITSVTRDDLADKGCGAWVDSITIIRKINPGVTLETLIPDFNGDPVLLDRIAALRPEIVSHNLETVERLTSVVRSGARYLTSLAVIRYLSGKGITTKSGIMLGLGESEKEIFRTMDDLVESGCQVFTMGQYLQPAKEKLPVQRYVLPEEFVHYRQEGLTRGFRFVESGPLVRSSYHAEKQLTPAGS
ncbi:MAG: lipoyl synthase [Bacteroidales bacterium]|jgi:lipoic acid synthetase|nr:lipoyl synthase [Bacteroidales bacterium]